MATQLKRVWKVLNTDIREFWHPAEVVASGADVSKAIVDCSLPLGVLALPLAAIAPQVSAGLFVVGTTARIIKFYQEKTKDQLTLEDGVALASQIAYLESFQVILAFPENQALLQRIGETPVSEKVKKQIENLGEFQINEQQARKVISCFHESELAPVFNEILLARLVQAGLTVAEAEILTERVSRNTHRYLNQALAEAGDAVKHLAQIYRDGWRKDIEKYDNIDEYLQDIAKKADDKVFVENFTIRDIYVPLKAKPVDKNGDVDEKVEAFYLEAWAKEVLNDSQKQDKVMFIQGGPGRGKSVFCRMFAELVRQHLHPIWTPVLIRLRDIPKLQPSFRETLREAVNADFATSDDGWLTDRNTRFLFLLDGFDELVMQGRSSGGLEEFLQQVGQFQRDCQQSKDMGHRVLITGRVLALYGMERQMPHNLERVEIQPMDDELQQQWFSKWSAQIGIDKSLAFQQFLQDPRCPDRVRELAREPLLLYLLAAMHRDGKLTVEMFEGASGVGAKILIYEQSLEWVLTEQRREWLNRKLTGQETEGLRRILAEAGLCVVQSGGECASMKMIESRLTGDDSAIELIQQARERHGEDALKNALAAFYLQAAAAEKGGFVEFAHKSFGEFLCAKRLKASLEKWTRLEKKGYEFDISTNQMDWEIYDLLGYGGLTLEIVEYLMALLVASTEFQPVRLFNRLENFYLPWSDGEFIDAPPENIPQKKMLQMREQTPGIKWIGLRQVDIYAGLNVTILLLELHRYVQLKDDLKDKIAFYLCGEKDTDSFDKYRLLRSIGYSECIGIRGFLETVGRFLRDANFIGAYLSNADLRVTDLKNAIFRGAYLNGADLRGAYLIRADLIGADLSGADLSRAILRDTILTDAILSGADLSYADLLSADLRDTILTHADLRGAYLSGVDFRGADLRATNLTRADLLSADLRGADLSYADVSGGDLENISWNEYTKWENVQGLETAVNVPEALKQQLGLD